MIATAKTSEQMLTVGVGDRRFALPARLVTEIARFPRVSRVPNAPEGMLGLANVRGSVVPVLSLAKLLLKRDGAVPRRMVVVDAGEPVGLAVDDVRQFEDGSADAAKIDVADLVARCIPLRAKSGATRGAIVAETAAIADRAALVAFRVGSQDFALPLTSVDEVIRVPDHIAFLPHADAVVVGSAAFRGATLPLLSLGALLALPSAEIGSQSRILVAWVGQHRVGLLADAMRSILWVDTDDIDPVPHVLTRGSAEAKIQAICRLDGGSRLVSVLSAEHLLREDITQSLMLQGGSGDNDAMDASESQQASEQFLVFRIGDEEFGLPIAAVEEIAPLPPKLTRLPKAPTFVQGVMNLRGEVIPVIDQVRRFHGVAATGRKKRVVVVRIGALRAGFVVDAVSEVQRVDAGELRPSPDFGTEGTRVFERVANLQEAGKIVLIVSPQELLDRAEQDLLRALGGKTASDRS